MPENKLKGLNINDHDVTIKVKGHDAFDLGRRIE